MSTPLPRIAIDLEKLRHINCGLGRFSLYLAKELLKVAPGRFEPVFFLPAKAERYFLSGGFDRIAVARWKKELFRQFMRPIVRPFLPPPTVSLWHVTNQMSKYLPLDPRVPVVLTIHDLNFLHEAPHDEQVSKISRKLADIQTKIDRSVAVVTDSQFVANDVASRLNLSDRPLHVVPLGLPPTPVPAATRPSWLPPGPFFLTIGNCLAHKNFHVLLDLAERTPDRRLVIAGKKATPYGDFLGREIARRGLEDRVLLPGEVHDTVRQWLYEACEAFFFPSLTEGFGFPVLEAMHAGRPVFVARTTCLPEIAGEHGFYLDSFDPLAMASTFHKGMATWAADHAFADRAKAHAATYSWGSTARGYARVYESIVGQSQS